MLKVKGSTRHRQTVPVVFLSGDDEEDPGIRSALVYLPRRMQKAGPKAHARRGSRGIAQHVPELVKRRGVVGTHLDVRQDRRVVTFREAGAVRRDQSLECRLGRGPGATESV